MSSILYRRNRLEEIEQKKFPVRNRIEEIVSWTCGVPLLYAILRVIFELTNETEDTT